ncbi:MAG: hypothetical protein EPO08_04510 [Rhodospirillaceae bacterium]|nr:MAG: hypothetical protein EPO08_04510 [Rhodospirillaceae bacterium]
MVFEIDPDKPDVPGIARILSGMGIFSLTATVVLMLLSFSRAAWVNEDYALAGAGGAFVLALILIGQAKTLELLALVSARVKSRFAIDQTLLAKAAVSSAPAEPKLPVTKAPSTGRVISIPEQVAREQGLTRNPEPRDFR